MTRPRLSASVAAPVSNSNHTFVNHTFGFDCRLDEQKQHSGPIMSKKITGIVAAILLSICANARASTDFDVVAGQPLQSERGLVEASMSDVAQTELKSESELKEQTQSSTTLPNGADYFKETYGDWGVECTIVEFRRSCSVGQSQYDQVHTTIYSIAIYPPENGESKVVILMPFGLKLSEGVTLKIDNLPSQQNANFVTCIKNGCIIVLRFSDKTLDILKTSNILKIGSVSFSSGESTTVNASLRGFSAAIERLRNIK